MARNPHGLVLADHLLDGQLADRLTTWRDEGLSWEQIARRLRDETEQKIDVTGRTVQDWAERLEVAA